MLQKQVLLDKVEVFPDGELHVHRTTIIAEDGNEIVRKQEIEKIKRGGTLPKDGGIVSIIASALWSASAVQDGLRDLNFKKGGLYYFKAKDHTPAPKGGGPLPEPDVAIEDPKALAIKHRGKEQGRSAVAYGRNDFGRSAPVAESKPIRHKGREHR
jgi:hypothetical protein